VRCPKDGGVIAERRGRFRPFYGCVNYPNCDFTLSARPIPEACPQCGNSYLLLRERKSGNVFACDKAGFATTRVDTRAGVRLVKQGDGFLIDRIALVLEATVPGIDEAKFQEIANVAKRDCPLSKALASVPEITLKAVLR